MLEARRIIDEFGNFMGVCVCEIEIIMDCKPVPGDTVMVPVPRLEILRKWMGEDESHSFGMAEGFIEGINTPREEPDHIVLLGAETEPVNSSEYPWDRDGASLS